MSNKAFALIGMMWTLGAGVFAQVDFWTFCKDGTAGDISAALVDNAKVQDRNARGMTPLMIAAEFNPNEGVVVVLLGVGAGLEDRDLNGATPLMWATMNPDASSVIRVMLDKGADPRARDRFGRTPLMWAALHTRSPGVVAALVEAGSEIDATDTEGRTALMLAAKYNASEVVAALLGAGADGAKKDRGGKSAYDYARENRTGLPGALLESLRKAERK
jgi:ankyrin repeat protein